MASTPCQIAQTNLESYLRNLQKPDRVAEAMATVRAGMLNSLTPLAHSIAGKFGQRVMEHGANLPVRMAIEKVYQLMTSRVTRAWVPPTIERAAATLREFKAVGLGQKIDFLPDAFHPTWGDTAVERGLDKYTTASMRPYEAETAAFKEWEFHRSVQEQAIVQSRNEQLRGTAFADRVNQLVKDARSDHLHPIAVNARADAEWMTAMNDNVISRQLTNTQGNLRRGQMNAAAEGKPVKAAGYAAGRLAVGAIAPFTRVPVNLALRTAVDYNPAIVAQGVAKLFTHEDDKGALDALSRGLTGGTLMGLGAYLYTKDRMTPSSTGQQGKQERADATESGRPGGAVLIPGTGSWIPTALSKNPALTMMQQGADLMHAASGGDTSMLHAGARMVSSDIAQSPFQEGASAVDALSQEGINRGGLTRLAGGKIGSLVPGPLATAAQLADPNQHDTSGSLLGAAQARIPFASRSLPDRFGSAGSTVTKPGLLNPFGITQEKGDPLYAALRGLGITVGLPSKAGSTEGERYSLSPPDYALFMRQYGPVLQARLRAYLTGVVQAPPGTKADELHALTEWARQHQIDGADPNFTRHDVIQSVKGPSGLIHETASEWKEANEAVLQRNRIAKANQGDRALAGLR